MSSRTDFENQAREYYQRHHMDETPHPRDVKALETELHNAFVAGQEAEAKSGPKPRVTLTPRILHDAILRALADLGHADAIVETGLRADRTEYDCDIKIQAVWR